MRGSHPGVEQDFGLDTFSQQDFWVSDALFRFTWAACNLISQHARKGVLKPSLSRKKRPWMDAVFRQIESTSKTCSFFALNDT